MTKAKSPLMQVTWHGKPVGPKVYADEILDMLAGWCPGMTSRKAKREAGKARRRERLRAARTPTSTPQPRGTQPSQPSDASPLK